MKTLIIYYSRTGTTKKLAEALVALSGADTEEIISVKNRRGVLGFLMSCHEAKNKKPVEIEPTAKNPADYDLIIIGTPIWVWNLSSPVRAYLMQNKDKFKNVAFFCTMGSSGGDQAFAKMEKICGKKPLATFSLRTDEVLKNETEKKIGEFMEKIDIRS